MTDNEPTTVMTPEAPQVTRTGMFSMQVCVPARYTDEEARDYAESQMMAGTSNGWQIRREGAESLIGHPERQPCAERPGYVHIVLDA